MMDAQIVERAVRIVSRFGWIRAYEMGLLLFPSVGMNPDSRRTMTRRIISWLKRMDYVVGVLLLGGSEALYLTKAGAGFARELWEEGALDAPPKFQARDWQHDCYVAQMLYASTAGNLGRLVTEHQIIQWEPSGTRRPDGLVMLYDSWLIVEVEHSRKSGVHMRNQVHRIASAIRGELEYCDRRVHGALVFYPSNMPGISHRTRLVNALSDVGIEGGVGPYLQLIGFQVRSQRHAIAKLITQRDGLIFSALQVEEGLPEPVRTGQKRGPRYDED